MSFDVTAVDLSALRELLRRWTDEAARLTQSGTRAPARRNGTTGPDSGEAEGLGPGALTLTFGFGPSLFEQDGDDRFGLADQRPAQLAPIPAIAGDELQPGRSGGDICVQGCAANSQLLFHAFHTLRIAAEGLAVPRWMQTGFLPPFEAMNDAPATPRNLMGFKDGTNNIRGDDQHAMDNHVWIGRSASPHWMRDGTYLVARRIRILLDVWDNLSVAQQEEVVGRHKLTGAPLTGRRESDDVNLGLRRNGAHAIPLDAHIRLASPTTNAGVRLLRRSYNYNDGIDQATSQVDAGLFFISFQRDPQKQFAAIQRRLSVHDAMAKHLSHTGSAVFACPPGVASGRYIGQALMG
jgi:deferrochelatase/peroxidase EfeB